MSTAPVSVVIVNWNGRTALERALPSVLESLQRAGDNAELVVVDNGSDDGSVEYLDTVGTSCRIIANEENRGFSPAANQGIEATNGTYVALLNNDVVCDPDWLVRLVEVADADQGIGCAAAQLRYLDDPERINSAGIVVDLLGRPHDRHDGRSAGDEPASPVDVFGGSGGALLLRRSMLDEIGLLDERFFAYFEDVDLAWRARRAGWRSVYVPTAVVLHEHSATSGRIRGLKRYLSTRNHIWLVVKNASPLHLAIAVWLLVPHALWTVVNDVVARDMSGTRGLLAAVRGVRYAVRRRHPPYLPVPSFSAPWTLRYGSISRHTASA